MQFEHDKKVPNPCSICGHVFWTKKDLTSRISGMTLHINDMHKNETPDKKVVKPSETFLNSQKVQNQWIENSSMFIKSEPMEDFTDHCAKELTESIIEIKQELIETQEPAPDFVASEIKKEPI